MKSRWSFRWSFFGDGRGDRAHRRLAPAVETSAEGLSVSPGRRSQLNVPPPLPRACLRLCVILQVILSEVVV